MCRITGYRYITTAAPEAAQSWLMHMRDSLSHGGPDDAGLYIDLGAHLGLAHRRLSILDLSPLGHQPMETERFVIVYNGEIYNFKAIRNELEAAGILFKTHSDTEVLLKGFEHWGPDVISRCRGMFAFALWDKQTQELTLCRDRVGVKPLFWYWKDGLFLFGSELKALMAHPQFDKTINPDALPGYFKVGYIQGPASIFKHVSKVMPGTFLTLNATGKISQYPYWKAEDFYQTPSEHFSSYEEALEAAKPKLEESFKLRLVSDVPVGIFLSGGVDSSLVASILSKVQPLKTFTIGFEDKHYNEAEMAKNIASHLGTHHTEYYCTESDFLALLPQIPTQYDEPFGGSSCIPTTLVSRLAKQQVSVALSADGGDELFGGYTKYHAGISFFPKLRHVPLPIRKACQTVLEKIDPLALDVWARQLPYLNRFDHLKDKFAKFRSACDASDLNDFFRKSGEYISDQDLANLLPNRTAPKMYPSVTPQNQHWVSYMGLTDILSYLPGDILTKVDRATMSVALEGREPFLDHHLIEFALGLPDTYKYRNGHNKAILRDLLKTYLPGHLIDPVKRGFGIPVYSWLKGPLKTQLQALANDEKFLNTFGLNGDVLRRWITTFLSNERFISAHLIWFLFQLWQWHNTWLR